MMYECNAKSSEDRHVQRDICAATRAGKSHKYRARRSSYFNTVGQLFIHALES